MISCGASRGGSAPRQDAGLEAGPPPSSDSIFIHVFIFGVSARERANLPSRFPGGGVLLEPEPHREREQDEPQGGEAEGEEREIAIQILRVMQTEGCHERGCSEGAYRRLDAGHLDQLLWSGHKHDKAVVEGM